MENVHEKKETVLVSKQSLNKILEYIRRMRKKKTREDKVLFIFQCYLKHNHVDKTLHELIRQVQVNHSEEAKSEILASRLYQDVFAFWTDRRIICFESSQYYFTGVRRNVVIKILDTYGENDAMKFEITKLPPELKELRVLFHWFSFLFPMVPDIESHQVSKEIAS